MLECAAIMSLGKAGLEGKNLEDFEGGCQVLSLFDIRPGGGDGISINPVDDSGQSLLTVDNQSYSSSGDGVARTGETICGEGY